MGQKKFPQKCRLFVEITDHQTPQRCCRLDIPASIQHLHQSIFVVYRVALNKVCVCIVKDNILVRRFLFLRKKHFYCCKNSRQNLREGLLAEPAILCCFVWILVQCRNPVYFRKIKIFIRERNSEWHHIRIVVLQNFFPRQRSEFVCRVPCCCTQTKLLH